MQWTPFYSEEERLMQALMDPNGTVSQLGPQGIGPQAADFLQQQGISNAATALPDPSGGILAGPSPSGGVLDPRPQSGLTAAMNSPFAAMASQGINNIFALRRNQVPRQTPVGAYQDAMMRNQALQMKRASMLDERERQAEARRRWGIANERAEKKEEREAEKALRDADPMYGFNEFVEQMGIQDLPYEQRLARWREFRLAGVKENSLPANVQTMMYMEQQLGRPLTPEERWEVIRSPSIYKAGGGQVDIRLPGGATDTLVESVDAIKREADEASATSQASAQGAAIGEKLAGAPGKITSGYAAIDVIDKMASHPGREAATGMTSIFNPIAPPGTSTRDFLTLKKQLQGKVFLEAFEMLKGGGQITEIEGLKAEQAMARLDEAQTEEEFLVALGDLRQAIADGLTKLEAQSGTGTAGGWSIKPKTGAK